MELNAEEIDMLINAIDSHSRLLQREAVSFCLTEYEKYKSLKLKLWNSTQSK